VRKAVTRSLDLQLERVGTAPAIITAPTEWIDRLAAVLVDNACKYAGEGGSVRIEVGRIGPRVVLAVEDTGPGIPLAERERLFDRFRRGTNQAGGHGLGLAMADSVVGGVPDAGDSSFEVDLGPMQPQCLTAPAAGQSQEGVERAVTVFATRFEERSEFATRPRIGPCCEYPAPGLAGSQRQALWGQSRTRTCSLAHRSDGERRRTVDPLGNFRRVGLVRCAPWFYPRVGRGRNVTAVCAEGAQEGVCPCLDVVAPHDTAHAAHACCSFVGVEVGGVADSLF